MTTKTYTFEQILLAQTAMRAAANPWKEDFPLPTIIGMLSEEISAMRRNGFTDEEIATLIQKSSNIALDAETLTDLHAPPKKK